MQNEHYEHLLENLRPFRISYHEYLVLQLPFYEPRQYADVPGYARALAPCAIDFPTDAQAFRAIARLIDRGLVEVITHQSIEAIKHYLRINPARGPTSGLPILGQLDLTPDGFAIWQQLWRKNMRLPDEICACDFVYRGSQTVIIFACDEPTAYSMATRCALVPVATPVTIGSWRSNWWHWVKSGVTVRCIDPDDT